MSGNEKVELYRDDAGEYRWRRWSSSDIVAASGEGYANYEDAAKRAALEADVHSAEFVDVTEEDAE